MVDEDSKLHGLLTGLAKIKTSYWELLIGIIIGLVLGLLVIGSMGEVLSIFVLLLEGIILLRLRDRVPKASTAESINSPLKISTSENSNNGSGNNLIPKIPKRPTPCPDCGSTRRHWKTCPRNKEKPKA